MATGRRISILVDSQGANKVASDLNKVNTIGDKVSASFHRITAGMKTFAKGALIATAAITGIAYAASRLSRAIAGPFEELELTMARVRVATSATAEQTKKMTAVANTLGRDTLYSAGQAAEGMMYLAKAGLNVEQVMAAIPGVLQAAIVEQMDLGTAADIVTGLLNEFGLAANKAGLAADVLAKGSNMAKTNMTEMSEGLKFFGATAHELGYSIEESVAMLDVLAGKMIRGTMAGTGMRQSMIAFQKIMSSGVMPTKAASSAIDRLGLDSASLAKQIASGKLSFMDFLGILKQAGATTGTFAEIFEQRAAVAINALASAAKTSFPQYVYELDNAMGFTKEAGKVLEDTLWGQEQQIKSSVQAMTNALMETLAPSLKEFLRDKMRPFINSITEAWENGGDTWQAKIKYVWETKLRPEMERGLASMGALFQEFMPQFTKAIGETTSQLILPVFKGILTGLWNLFSLAFEGWREGIDYVLNTLGDLIIKFFTDLGTRIKNAVFGFTNDIISVLNKIPGITITPITIGSPGALPDESSKWGAMAGLPGVPVTPPPATGVTPPGMPTTSPLGPGTSQNTDAVNANTDVMQSLEQRLQALIDNMGPNTDAVDENTKAVNQNTDASGGATSFGATAGKWISDLLTKGVSSLVGGIEGVLIGAVTQPITDALSEYLAPTMEALGKLVRVLLHVFDPLLYVIDRGLDVLINLFGGPDYTGGRYTGAGAYQAPAYAYATGGIAMTPQTARIAERGPEIILPLQSSGGSGAGPMSASSSVTIEHMEINGTNGQDVGAEAAQEIARHEELTTRQIARSMQQGMIKREAMER